MSKASELRALRYGRSVDAPINYHHRTGDSEGESGNMLDLYAQEKSVEEVIFEEEDELAKARFLKGFQGYLRKVFSRTEREFLRRLMSGNEKLQDVGRGMGVDWFKFMQSIQRKAYKNTKPLLKLSEVTGWSRAEEFTIMIMRRLALLDEGAELDDLLPKAANRAKVREALKAANIKNNQERKISESFRNRQQWQKHREIYLIKAKEYYKKHREEIRKKRNAWYADNKEKEKERKNTEQYKAIRIKINKKYRENNKEKCKDLQKKWREENKEKLRKYRQKYREENREKILAYKKADREKNREKNREKEAARNKAYREKNREKEAARGKAYREKNREKEAARGKAYRQKKKAEREAAKAAQS